MSELLKVATQLMDRLSGEDFILISDTSDGGIFKRIPVYFLFSEIDSMTLSGVNQCIDQQIFLGQLLLVAFNYAPKGWALCDGRLLLIADNQALFSLLRTTYGGNGTTDFALPDLRGRFALGTGNGDGVANAALGRKGGSAIAAIPSSTVGAEGGGQLIKSISQEQIATVPPYLAINYIIAIEGKFPD